jgi:glycosyltransferase involved in cell wall biosynthesis
VDADQWQLFPARTIVPGAGMLGLGSGALLRHLWSASNQADVVHVHAGRDLVSLSALLVAALRHRPVVAQTHGMVFPRRHLRARVFDRLFLPLLRRASTIFYLNEGERNDLAQMLGPSAALCFLGNGIEPSGSGVKASRSDLPTVTFAARLHPVKGVTAFAEMAAIIRDRGVPARFLVYGADQGDLANLQRIIDAKGLFDVLTYCGALPHDHALRAIAESDVFVLASRFEPWGMTVLEAMAAGVPVVLTTGSPLGELLRARESAKVTDGSPAELADAVQGLLEDGTEWKRLSTLGPSTVEELFSMDAVVDTLRQHYARAGS